MTDDEFKEKLLTHMGDISTYLSWVCFFLLFLSMCGFGK